jgi:RNA polymerase sigma-70 factor (ECF subfamily)
MDELVVDSRTRTATDHGEHARATAAAVARRSYGKLVAFLAAGSRDVAAAEDALADAFAAALANWPAHGVPHNPEAWLLTTGRRKLLDYLRRRATARAAEPELEHAAELLALGEEGDDVTIPDHRLALMFACAHPAIDETVRAPLLLQSVLGFDAAMIASAFLASPAAMSQRLVRAKTKIKQAGIPLRVPEREELAERLDAVLAAIYAAFAEGWQDPAGTEPARRELAEEALYLGRLMAELLPDQPEAYGLLALMLYADARRHARRTQDGDYVPLAEQDSELWDDALIDEAEALLVRASEFRVPGRYQLEAALQSAHVNGRRAGHVDWPALLVLYDALLELSGSPVVAINRALALAHVRGAGAALASLDALAADARLADYQPYWAARAELLVQTRALSDARAAYARAIGLERDAAIRRFLQRRLAAL